MNRKLGISNPTKTLQKPPLIETVRNSVTAYARKVLLKFGIAKQDIALHRDIALGLFSLVPVIFSCLPLFEFFDGSPVGFKDIYKALGWFAVVFFISMLSVHWSAVLGSAYGVLAGRGVVVFVLTGGDRRIVVPTIVFAGICLAICSLQPENFNQYKRSRYK